MRNRMGEVKQKLGNRNSPTYCVTVEHLAKIPLETKAGPISMKRPSHFTFLFYSHQVSITPSPGQSIILEK